MRFSLFAALIVGFALTAFGQSSNEVLKNLEAAMRKELSGPGGPGPDRRGEAERFVISGPAQIEAAINSGEPNRIDDLLSRVGVYFSSDEVRQQMTLLRAAIRKEREDKQNAQIAAINAALKQASDAVRNAKNPEDLDETLKTLARYRNTGGSARYSEEGQTAAQKVQSTMQFVRRWQEYLVARKGGNRERCRQALQNLTSNDETMEIIPRSQLLAELEKYAQEPRPEPTRSPEPTGEPPSPEEISAIVSKAKTLDAIPGILKELRARQGRARSSGGYDVLATTINNLVAIDRSYKEFQVGFPTKIEFSSAYNPDTTSPALIPLRAQLLLLILPRHLHISGDLMPQAGETLDAYLQRIIDEAKKRGDGPLLNRTREALRMISGTNFFGADYNAVNSFSAAQNQEAAGQFELAVVSYQQALKVGSDALPAKFVGERLTALKNEHPAEYEEGMKKFNAPPPWADGPFSGMGYRSGPWAPPYPTPAGPSSIFVPAATPNSKPVATPSPTATASPAKPSQTARP